MAQTSNAGSKKRERDLYLPSWAVPILNTCDGIYTLFLSSAGVLLVLMLALLFVGYVGPKYAWEQNVLSIFMFLVVIGYLAAVIARYDAPSIGWLGGILGTAFVFGGPMVILRLAVIGGAQAEDAPFVKNFNGSITNIGIYLIAVGVLQLILIYAYRLIYGGSEGEGAKQLKYIPDTKQRKSHTRPSLIPKCWEMSRCRPGVRTSCPNFTDKATCWKRRSGCFCDRNLANFLVGSVDRKEAGEVIDMEVATEKVDAAEMRAHLTSASRRPWKQQKLLCHECPLYLEHQEYKYRYWHWVSFPLTFAVVAACYNFFHIGYVAFAEFLNEVMVRLVKMGGLPDNFTPSASGLKDSPFEYLLLAMLSLLLASYVVNFTDTLFLKWKV